MTRSFVDYVRDANGLEHRCKTAKQTLRLVARPGGEIQMVRFAHAHTVAELKSPDLLDDDRRPSSYALMLAGLAGIGTLVRLHRRDTTRCADSARRPLLKRAR